MKLQQGHRYESKLKLSWVESLAPEATIENEAAKESREAGFVGVSCWRVPDGSHWVVGTWPLADREVDLPDHIEPGSVVDITTP